MSEGTNTIDSAIETCEANIRSHKRNSKLFLMAMFAVVSLFIMGQLALNINEVSKLKQANSTFDDATSFIKNLDINLMSIEAGYKDGTEDGYAVGYDAGYGPAFTNAIRLSSPMPINPQGDSVVTSRTHIDSVSIVSTLQWIQNLRLATDELQMLPKKIYEISPPVPESMLYILYGIFILIFGVVTSFYRFHLKEISKYEHHLLGFNRIRIAGNNSITGYDDYVKYFLSKDAFSSDSKSSNDKFDSPLPGHPSSDISATIVNKLIEKLDIKDLLKKESSDKKS